MQMTAGALVNARRSETRARPPRCRVLRAREKRMEIPSLDDHRNGVLDFEPRAYIAPANDVCSRFYECNAPAVRTIAILRCAFSLSLYLFLFSSFFLTPSLPLSLGVILWLADQKQDHRFNGERAHLAKTKEKGWKRARERGGGRKPDREMKELQFSK